jgi:hypothetical protein
MASKNKGGGGKGSKKDGVGGGLVCAHCKTVGELDTMKRCSRCRRVCYCSVECQKLHWKSGGHKNVCGKDGGSGASTDGAGASGGVDAAPKHPCPICLVKEDNDGNTGMCVSCGQMYCGSCSPTLVVRGVTSCPTCRAVLGLSETEHMRQLRQLLARPPGRYTLVAQELLGVCYERGTGVVQDEAEAVRWYRLAADQGNARAQVNLGVRYQNGTGVAQDAAEAVRWYRLAADQGHAEAQYNVGTVYQNGAGVPQDSAEAARWFRLAADQGNALALAAVAQLGL